MKEFAIEGFTVKKVATKGFTTEESARFCLKLMKFCELKLMAYPADAAGPDEQHG